jgi:signal transduction histidine kinase
MAITGLFAPLLPTAAYLPELTVALVCVAVLTSLAFHRRFLALFDPPRWMRWALDALLLASAGAMLLCLAGQPLRGLWLNGMVALSAGPVFFLLALRARREAPPGRRTLRVLYGLLMASLLVTFAPLLGLLPASPWNLQGGLIQGLLGAGMMGSMLFMRAHTLRRQGLLARLALDRAQSQVLAQRNRLEEQQHFMAMLTHEIKNPLATIRLTLDMLKGDETRRQRIGRAIADVEAILERCGQVDRLEQGDWPSDTRACVLAQLVDEVAAHGKEPSRIHVAHEPPGGVVHTDPLLLSVALGNLIDNALKYGDPAAPIDVRTHPRVLAQGLHLAVTVSNRAGPGGPPDGSRFFSKYHRGAEALGQSGSGLGLYLVRGIMTRLNGAVDHSVSGEEVRFTLTLPAQGQA